VATAGGAESGGSSEDAWPAIVPDWAAHMPQVRSIPRELLTPYGRRRLYPPWEFTGWARVRHRHGVWCYSLSADCLYYLLFVKIPRRHPSSKRHASQAGAARRDEPRLRISYVPLPSALTGWTEMV
jgi:hypothetical protein